MGKRLRWSRGSVLAFGTQVRGFTPGQSRRIFRAKKILSTTSFGGEVKPSVPCRSFTACKRSPNRVKVIISAKLPDISSPQFHLPPLGALAWWHAWRCLVAKVGTSNQDRIISLKAAVRSCTKKKKDTRHRMFYLCFQCTDLSNSPKRIKVTEKIYIYVGLPLSAFKDKE